jgi:hypothetical protein
MKTKSVVRSIGVLLTLLVFVSLSTSLLAVCFTHDPICELYYGTGHNLSLEVSTSCPANATIFFISSLDQPIPGTTMPCHVGATPCQGTSAVPSETKIPIQYGHTLYIRMLAWRSDSGDSGIVDCDQHNPVL